MNLIDQLDAALAGMTPGPWETFLDDGEARPGIEAETCTVVIQGYFHNGDDDGGIRGKDDAEAIANARGIVALRNESAALLDLLRRAVPILKSVAALGQYGMTEKQCEEAASVLAALEKEGEGPKS